LVMVFLPSLELDDGLAVDGEDLHHELDVEVSHGEGDQQHVFGDELAIDDENRQGEENGVHLDDVGQPYEHHVQLDDEDQPYGYHEQLNDEFQLREDHGLLNDEYRGLFGGEDLPHEGYGKLHDVVHVILDGVVHGMPNGEVRDKPGGVVRGKIDGEGQLHEGYDKIGDVLVRPCVVNDDKIGGKHPRDELSEHCDNLTSQYLD